MDEMVTITKKKYDELIKHSNWLSCLEAAGVDNWDGYSDAYDYRKAWYPENEDEEEEE